VSVSRSPLTRTRVFTHLAAVFILGVGVSASACRRANAKADSDGSNEPADILKDLASLFRDDGDSAKPAAAATVHCWRISRVSRRRDGW
jgi:hypothetical protein